MFILELRRLLTLSVIIYTFEKLIIEMFAVFATLLQGNMALCTMVMSFQVVAKNSRP